jgi:prepilin-type N-terminal cleavage/methylation domain-containing protein/prepilin-type processing-associated H-X9-DG protein
MKNTSPILAAAKPRSRAGFTLIELLVVIAIISILAAILFPVFAQARNTARQSSCLSNQKQIGLALMQYAQNFDETYPSCYYYVNGATSADGYVQWSGSIQPYCKNTGIFVCPQHKSKGWSPTNFTTSNAPAGQTPQTAGVDDIQVPRLSYVPNELLLPRKKYAAVPQSVVGLSMVDAPADVIIIAEYTNNVNALKGTSATGGIAIKSHRPTSGVKLVSGGVFDGETWANGSGLMALTADEAWSAVSAGAVDGTGQHHICYSDPSQHDGGANYVFADGHAKWMTLEQTLDPLNFKWGKKGYSCPDMPDVMQADGVTPVL